MDIINLLLHIDTLLFSLVGEYGNYIYLFLFLVIFLETGIVLTPILPGDTLLFTAGALAGTGQLDIAILFILLTSAAIVGDSLNYFIGNRFGNLIIKKRLVSEKRINYTNALYEKHGGKIIIIARFLPIIRTFAPFIAGIGKMQYTKFSKYNITGALLWTISFLSIGYFVGNLEIVKQHFTSVFIFIFFFFYIIAIVLNYFVKKNMKIENKIKQY